MKRSTKKLLYSVPAAIVVILCGMYLAQKPAKQEPETEVLPSFETEQLAEDVRETEIRETDTYDFEEGPSFCGSLSENRYQNPVFHVEFDLSHYNDITFQPVARDQLSQNGSAPILTASGSTDETFCIKLYDAEAYYGIQTVTAENAAKEALQKESLKGRSPELISTPICIDGSIVQVPSVKGTDFLSLFLKTEQENGLIMEVSVSGKLATQTFPSEVSSPTPSPSERHSVPVFTDLAKTDILLLFREKGLDFQTDSIGDNGMREWIADSDDGSVRCAIYHTDDSDRCSHVLVTWIPSCGGSTDRLFELCSVFCNTDSEWALLYDSLIAPPEAPLLLNGALYRIQSYPDFLTVSISGYETPSEPDF